MLRINIPYWFERKGQKVGAVCERRSRRTLRKTFTEHLRKPSGAVGLPKKSDFDVARTYIGLGRMNSQIVVPNRAQTWPRTRRRRSRYAGEIVRGNNP